MKRIKSCEGHMRSINDTYFSHSKECNPFWPICDKKLSLENMLIYRVASVPVGWLAIAIIYSLDSMQVKYRLEKDHVLDSRWGCWPTRWPIFLTWKPSWRMESSAPRPEPRRLSCVAQYSWRRAVCLLQPRWVCFIWSVPLKQHNCFIALFYTDPSFVVRLTDVNAE